jgi:hypothetical protein
MTLGFSKMSDYRWFSLTVVFFCAAMAVQKKTPQKITFWVAPAHNHC